jgi:cytoskeletal protein CcmA (bactofilin family)
MLQKKRKMGDTMKNVAVFLAVLTLSVPLSADAETVLRIGKNISVEADQVVDGDYYVSAGPAGHTTMSGTVTEDMYAFGGSVTANGSVGKDLTVIAGTSQLHASVTDDVRILAGEATLAEHVGGDLFVVGGKLTMLSTASVDGDVIFFGGEAEINGNVGGSILGTSERLRVDGKIGKDINVKTASLTLGERAIVNGSVTYASLQSVVRAQNAVVEGEVVQNEYTTPSKETDARNALIPVFVALFAALSLFLLFRKELQVLVQEVHLHPLRSGIIGVAVLILGPVLSVILIATILGIFVGIAGVALSVLAYVLGYALSGVVLGSFLAKLFTQKVHVSLMWIVIGTFALHALLMIPVVGVFVFFAVFVLTVGAVSYSTYKLFS